MDYNTFQSTAFYCNVGTWGISCNQAIDSKHFSWPRSKRRGIPEAGSPSRVGYPYPRRIKTCLNMPSVLNSPRKPNGRKDFQGFRYTGQDRPIPCAIFPIQYSRVKSGTYGNQRVRPPQVGSKAQGKTQSQERRPGSEGRPREGLCGGGYIRMRIDRRAGLVASPWIGLHNIQWFT